MNILIIKKSEIITEKQAECIAENGKGRSDQAVNAFIIID